MSVAAEFTFFPEPRPAVMVVSHERSGTHFLMNSLAACYGYVSRPWINFDNPTKSVLELYSREEIRKILLEMTDRPMANIVKSHHTADFFTGELEAIAKRYVIFVIYRDPVSVMLSYWRFMHRFQESVNAGPRVGDPLTFAQAKPFGRMLRYQSQSCDTILDRWVYHVKSWQTVAPDFPNIQLVCYEDLDLNYETTMKSFAALLGREPQSFTRPSRNHMVIPAGPNDPLNTGISPDLEALRRLCLEKVGETMARLGH